MSGTITRPTVSAGQGINEYCRQLKQAALVNAQINNQAASVCYSSYSSCTSSCGALISKYQGLVASCNGSCAGSSLYAQTLSQLQSRNQTCSGYSTVVSALGAQGSTSTDASQSSAQCDQLAQASPNSTSSIPGASAQTVSGAPTDCVTNPSGPGCQPPVAAPTAQDRGSAAFQKVDKADGGFYLPTPQVQSPEATIAHTIPAMPPTVQSIPNNSGGAIPQQGSGLEAAPRASVAAAQAATEGDASTNIDQGFRTIDGVNYDNGNSISEYDSTWRQSALTARAPASESSGLLGFDLHSILPHWLSNLLPESWTSARPATSPAEARLGLRCVSGKVNSPPGCNPRLPPLKVGEVQAQKTDQLQRAASAPNRNLILATLLLTGLSAGLWYSRDLEQIKSLRARFPLINKEKKNAA